MKYIKVLQAAEKWGLSPRRVRLLCAQNRIDGVVQKGKLYMIPENAPKPVDAKRNKSVKGAFSPAIENRRIKGGA